MHPSTLQVIQAALSNDETLTGIERQAVLDFCGRHNSLSQLVHSLRDIDSVGGLVIVDERNREVFSDGRIQDILVSGSAIVIIINGRNTP